MPIPFKRLDNVVPATWESVWSGISPEPDDPYIDPETACRFIEGQDHVNYFTSQRYQGDLFKRDLINGLLIKRVIDYLGARSGYFFNMPGVNLPAGTYLTLGALMDTSQIEGYYAVMFTLNLDSGTPADFEIRIVDQDSGATIDSYTPSGLQNTAWAVTSNNINGERGQLINNFEVRLYNKGSTSRVVQASAVLSPKIAWETVSGSSASS